MKISYDCFRHKFGLTAFADTAAQKPLNVAWVFSLCISTQELWPFIADTSRFNRELGMAARTEREENGKKVVTSKLVGLTQEWIEEPWTWAREKSIESIRHFTRGFVSKSRANFHLESTSDGVKFYVGFSWLPTNIFWRGFLIASAPLLKTKFAEVLTRIETQVLSEREKKTSALPLTRCNDPLANVNLSGLKASALALKKFDLDPRVIDGLCDFIKTGDDADLYRIKVVDLARRLAVPQKDLLRACMYGVRQGLLTITWDVICPHCRGSRVTANSLGEIPAIADCRVCEIDFETDKYESIEVFFHVHPSFRKVEEILFCAAEPAKKSHITIQTRMPANAVSALAEDFKEGSYRLRLTGQRESMVFTIDSKQPAREVVWNGTAAEKIVCGPCSSFKIQNDHSHDRILTVEELYWQNNALYPADIFAIQEFHDVFSRESLSADVKISLGVQVVMFTDIVNSTGFYAQHGDAVAFNEVKSHFRETFEAVAEHDGTVIKTIGDSVMACFKSPEQALAAAVAIQTRFYPQRKDTPIRLRIALHHGQVIAVQLSEGIDLFGMTVNKAAKLMACANVGEIALSNELYHACGNLAFKSCQAHLSPRSTVAALQAHVLDCHAMLTSAVGINFQVA